MNDLDRWVTLQGPEPPGVRELFDAVREGPDLTMTPELEAELDRRVFAAIAEDERRWAAKQRRKRTAQVAVALGLLAAGFAGAIGFADALRAAVPHAASVVNARTPLPSEPALRVRDRPSPAPPPSGSATSPPPPPTRLGRGR